MDNTYQGVILSPKVVPNLSRALVPDYLRRSIGDIRRHNHLRFVTYRLSIATLIEAFV